MSLIRTFNMTYFFRTKPTVVRATRFPSSFLGRGDPEPLAHVTPLIRYGVKVPSCSKSFRDVRTAKGVVIYTPTVCSAKSNVAF